MGVKRTCKQASPQRCLGFQVIDPQAAALEHPATLKNRPALRLDSRLVCKYEVLSVIGKGSFSQVLRVQHRVTRHFYAVKLVSADCGTVNNELSILSRVSHPFVIRLEEVIISCILAFVSQPATVLQSDICFVKSSVHAPHWNYSPNLR